MSQILISLPLLVLYEISIYVSAFILRKNKRIEAAALKRLEEREKIHEARKEAYEKEKNDNLPMDQRF